MALLVYITVPDSNFARKLALELLKHKLVACVNIVPKIQSLYWWQGQIEESEEYLLLAKTKDELFESLKQFVLELHPYDCPCIVAWPLTHGHIDFMNWIHDSTLNLE